MKASLLLTTNLTEVAGESDSLDLVLGVNGLRKHTLSSLPVEEDKEIFLTAIEDLFRESEIYRNAMPGLKLLVDDSVLKYLEIDSEEVRNFVNSLRVEM